MRGHPVKLEAGETELRRLSAGDFERLLDIGADILENAANRSLLTGVKFDPSNTASLMVTLFAGLRGVRAQIREFAVSLVPEGTAVTGNDLGLIIEAMTTHPDVTGFLESMRRIAKSQFAVDAMAQLNETQREIAHASST